MLSRYPSYLRALAFPLLILAGELAVVEFRSQMAALITTQLFGANGPAFQDVAYYSKVLFVIPVLLLGARYFEKRSFDEVGFAPRHVWQNILLGLTISATVMGLTTLVLALAGWYHVTERATRHQRHYSDAAERPAAVLRDCDSGRGDLPWHPLPSARTRSGLVGSPCYQRADLWLVPHRQSWRELDQFVGDRA